MDRWDEVEDVLRDEAERDLRAGSDVRPCLAAGDRDETLMLAFLRPFPKGAYSDPMIEVLALAGPLGADRLALSISGRAWSLDDPIPPVLPGVVDLRQRILVQHLVERTDDGVRSRSRLRPFTVAEGGVQWGPAIDDHTGQGWLMAAMRITMECVDELWAPPAAARGQVDRCRDLGHLVALSPVAVGRLSAMGTVG